ncbi:DUF6115 domain-containing protein [[Clostridium] polysaccharolyticum]|uniref:Uncharacterized protein n=1 Tax=[Clostridium] polysaccharolyticum TaxID=29364 RepID=A0A1H9Y3I5_9FIRM|nr:DUF6115 domain-containing protein [[Clostridium] polysaccharolyticum]SES63283.1 hypothetical protein SAMN04487772_101109 [[Clostridium] polysaccharolyticum]
MQGFYIVLIILGIICVILSFMLAERLEGRSSENEFHISEDMFNLFIKKNEESLESALRAHADTIKEDTLEDVKKELNRMANEKIMAVDEFSDSVLEKINQNHSEVIFLYNMLNEKERELKELVADVNKAANKGVAKSESPSENAGGKETKKARKASNREKNNMKPASQGQVEKADKLVLSEEEKKSEADSREEVLRLYQQGLSATEIARQLQMGQGEIKLIIDLYQGAR